jgi:hypothetical protein
MPLYLKSTGQESNKILSVPALAQHFFGSAEKFLWLTKNFFALTPAHSASIIFAK